MIKVTIDIYDIEKGEIPPCSGEYNIMDDDGGWSRAVWAGVWEEWFGPKQPHLWAYKKPPVEMSTKIVDLQTYLPVCPQSCTSP